MRVRALFFAAIALLIVLVARPAQAAPDAEDGPVLVVGLTGQYPPFNFFDEQGELSGFDVDFARAVCRETHRRCEFRTLQWDGIIGALLAGRIDAIVGSMAVTPERSKAVLFSAPYYESGPELFVRDGAGDASRPGFAIGVTLGTTYEKTVHERFPKAEVRVFKGDVQALADMGAGRLDGLVTDRLVGAYMARKAGVVMRPDGPPIYEEKMGIPVAPSNTALHAEIDAAVKRIRASAEYGELQKKWFGELDSPGAAPAAAPSVAFGRAAGLLAHGLLATILVCIVGLGLGILLAIGVAAALVFGGRLARPLAVLVDFIRATPFMVQLFAIYFGLPSLGLKVDAWTSAVAAISIQSAAYLAEVIKTSYASVPRGQHQAARALGLRRMEALRHVVLPQMMPVMSVPVLNTIVAMIKDSAIVSVIGVYELTLQAQQLISATFQPMVYYLAAAFLYFLVTYPILLAGRRLEARFKARGLLHA